MKIQGAAISIEGVNLAIALVGMELVNNPGEADMAIESMQPSFGGVPVVLMAQKEDGTPVYYGDEELVRSLAFIPVEEMPWKEYSI
jgi:hypothetical protein